MRTGGEKKQLRRDRALSVIRHQGILSSIKRRNSAGESSKFVNWISSRSQIPGLWTTRRGRKKKEILWIALFSAISPYANRTIRCTSDDRQTRWKKLHETSIVNLKLLCRVEDLTAKICQYIVRLQSSKR